jgi:hypothetical protein
MATSNYKPYQRSGEPFTLGYYVFDLPNGQVLDMLDGEPVVIPDGDLSKLPMRYVERDVRFFGENPPSPKGKTMRLPIVPVSPAPSRDVIDNLESLSDEEMLRVVFGDVQSHAEAI